MSDAQFADMLIFWNETYMQTIWLAAVFGGVLGSVVMSLFVGALRLLLERVHGELRD